MLNFGGEIYVIYYLLLHEHQTNINLFQITRYHPCGTSYWNKVFLVNTCAADQFYITTLI